MSELFIQALQITALGMGLVFAAIVLLWGMMSLLTAITTERAPGDSGRIIPATDEELKAQAAAVAVAIALAEQETSTAHPLPDPPTAFVSAWQLGMRSRQMSQKGGSIRR